MLREERNLAKKKGFGRPHSDYKKIDLGVNELFRIKKFNKSDFIL